jgi:hypothetical protein
MTRHDWEQWELAGRSKHVVVKRLELPSNRGKPIHSARMGFCQFCYGRLDA